MRAGGREGGRSVGQQCCVRFLGICWLPGTCYLKFVFVLPEICRSLDPKNKLCKTDAGKYILFRVNQFGQYAVGRTYG